MITKRAFQNLKRKRCIELTSEAKAHGGYLWTAHDLDNALAWFQGGDRRSSTTSSRTRHDDDNNEEKEIVNGDNEGTKDNDDAEKGVRRNRTTTIARTTTTTKGGGGGTRGDDKEREDSDALVPGLQLLRSLLQNPGIGEDRPPLRRRRQQQRTTKKKRRDGEEDCKKTAEVNDDGVVEEGGREREPLLSRVIVRYLRDAVVRLQGTDGGGSAGDGDTKDDTEKPRGSCCNLPDVIDVDADDSNSVGNGDGSTTNPEDQTSSLLRKDLLRIASTRYTTETLFHEYHSTTTAIEECCRTTTNPRSTDYDEEEEEDGDDYYQRYFTNGHVIVKMTYASELYDRLLDLRRIDNETMGDDAKANTKTKTMDGISTNEIQDNHHSSMLATANDDNDSRTKRQQQPRPKTHNRSSHLEKSKRFLNKLITLSRLDKGICEVLALMLLEPTSTTRRRNRSRLRKSGNTDRILEYGGRPNQCLEDDDDLMVEEQQREITSTLCHTFLQSLSSNKADDSVIGYGGDDDGVGEVGIDEKKRRRGDGTTNSSKSYSSWNKVPPPLIHTLSKLYFPIAKAYIRFLIDDAVESFGSMRAAAETNRIVARMKDKGDCLKDGSSSSSSDSSVLVAPKLVIDDDTNKTTIRYESCIDELKRLAAIEERLLLLIGDVIASTYNQLADENISLVSPSTSSGGYNRRSLWQALEDMEQRIFSFFENELI